MKNYDIAIENLDFEIENIYAAIDKAKGEIVNTEIKIEQTTKDIAIAERNITGEEELFNKRMRVMFMNGADTYLEVILNSKGFEDFISRVENVKSIVEYDNKIMSELNVKKQKIEQRKISLNENKIKILALQVDNENKLDKLNIKKQEQHNVIVEAEKQQKLHKIEIAQTEALMGSTMNKIEDAAIQTRKYELAMATRNAEQITPSRGMVSNVVKTETKVETKAEAQVETNVEPTKEVVKEVSQPPIASSVSSNEVIAYAKRFLGTPYEWAATGPNTFDCSGFVQYVYTHFGVTTGRSTYDQITHGVFVARANLQPGDLVFFGSGTPHHVGIYVGNNSYIHAPKTGDVVKISLLTRSDYLSARRVR